MVIHELSTVVVSVISTLHCIQQVSMVFTMIHNNYFLVFLKFHYLYDRGEGWTVRWT